MRPDIYWNYIKTVALWLERTSIPLNVHCSLGPFIANGLFVANDHCFGLIHIMRISSFRISTFSLLPHR